MWDSLILTFRDFCTHLKIEFLLIWNSNHLLFGTCIVYKHLVLLVLILLVVIHGCTNWIVTTSQVVRVLSRQLSLDILILVELNSRLALTNDAF